MAKSHVELDFFGLQSLPHPPQPRHRLDRRESFRGIAKINPEIVKNVIASKYGAPAAADNNPKSVSLPGTPRLGFSQLPVFHPQPQPQPRAGSMEKAGETAPMTIFYNGTVSVFDLPHDKAEHVMKLAMEKYGKVLDDSSLKTPKISTNTENIQLIQGSLSDDGDDADMPIKRKKSLQRFFEKRKERLVSPYANMEHMVTGVYQQKT
ncbi:protein TIFY 9-like isoform X2 [Chenopodium quinoa]|uniref:protein TIFY 9-like isoform X2 n=1 Tax=Chenopodium quinoa TaxID=63459 RepID=UPI000B77CDED|nr:protein TIFY 9-like isoform X2 [Chenopodium quinoa]